MGDFKLPDVGEGISEAELIEWRVRVGQDVDEDEIVAFIGTDKVNVELPSPRSGRIAELCWDEGDIVPVGETLIRFESDAAAPPGSTEPDARSASSSAVGTASQTPSRTEAAPSATGTIVAAPSTRRYAAEHGVDIAAIAGSGPAGRILRDDVDRALEDGRDAGHASDATTSGSSQPVAGGTRFEPVRGIRSVASRRMAASAQQTASSTTTFEVHADGLQDLVEQVRRSPRGDDGKLTPLAVVSKCIAAALQQHPRFNATIAEDGSGLNLHTDVHLAIAVASEEGLTVPVLRDASRRTVTELATAIRDLASRARDGALEVADLQGGTFTVSSTGGLEQARIVSTVPLINLPQVAILWFSRIEDRPRVRDGVLEAGPVLTASVTFDHRFIDGAEVTAFINTLAAFLEHPVGALA